jgi:hypothetical protein
VYVGHELAVVVEQPSVGPEGEQRVVERAAPAPRSTRSLTPTTSVTAASRAMAASASNAGPGTVTLAAAMRAKTALAGRGPRAPRRGRGRARRGSPGSTSREDHERRARGARLVHALGGAHERRGEIGGDLRLDDGGVTRVALIRPRLRLPTTSRSSSAKARSTTLPAKMMSDG